jgi:carboxyl-terminal processing protease
LINEIKTDDKVLEEDAKDDPRFALSAEDLKKKGVEDFQLDYALKTISRLASTPGATIAQAQAARKPGAK